MKKILLTIICISFLSAVTLSARSRQLANENKDGLYVRSIEQTLRLEPDQIDIATAVLIISELWNDNVLGRKYVSKLDDMAYEMQKRLRDEHVPLNYKAIVVINKYLFDELGFKTVETANDPNDLFLHSVMDAKRGYCLSLSVLYLSLGERLGLPLHGVVVPGHFFVRYDDGQNVRFNIETTSKGGYADNQHYIDKFGVPDNYEDSIYLKNLDKMQTLGCFFNNLGNSYNDVGNNQQAQVALERAVEINPSLLESRLNLGNIYLELGYIDDAIYQYKTAIEINPKDAKTYNNLGNAYARTDRIDDAIFQYKLALEFEPDYTDVYPNLAIAYAKKQKFEKAASLMRKAIILQPKNTEYLCELGNIHSQQGDYQQAIGKYKKALRIKPDLAKAYFGLALCYNKLEKTSMEIKAYKNALAIDPYMMAALANLGNAYFAKEKYDAAIEQYRKAVKIEPTDALIYYNLGGAYFNKAEYEQAAAWYMQAVELDPQMADAHKGLAFCYFNLEKYNLAKRHARITQQLGIDLPEKLLNAIEKKTR